MDFVGLVKYTGPTSSNGVIVSDEFSPDVQANHPSRLPTHETKIRNEPINHQEAAKSLVHLYFKARKPDSLTDPKFALYVVWFTKILDNWKALVCTTLNDGLYFEVTYNGFKQETYVDVYSKIENHVISDNHLSTVQ